MLIERIPDSIKLRKALDLPKRMGEKEALDFIEERIKNNKVFDPSRVFVPDPPYFSYIPAAVDYISSATELLTSYTPYQAEVSQGLLQILFEYQSMICELTGMEVANASLYDHSTAVCEAVRMALKYTERKKILIPKYMRKERKQVIYTYLKPLKVEISEYSIEEETGMIDLSDIENKIKNSACIYAENPSYFGVLDENITKLSELKNSVGSLLIVGIEPIAQAILKEPASYDADIVVGEAQHLAIPPFYGGPSLGIIACKNEIKLIHLMPGRMVGATTTIDGSRLGFSLVLQAREQHIKRERATSNITTNQSWLAVRAAIFLALLGKAGLKSLACRILLNTKEVSERISELGITSPLFKSLHFRNFLIKDEKLKGIKEKMINKGFLFGKEISKDFEEFKDCLLIGVNEFHDEKAINSMLESLKEVLKNV